MIPDPSGHVFALTLKRWFAGNGWPQKVTDDWAKDTGIQHPHGPWASQMCGAMKADGYNPKAEFFLALARFNEFVAQQDLKAVVDIKLRKRLENASPLRHDNGDVYTASDFWSLFAGILEPPSAFARSTEFTQEDADEWMKLQRDSFRKLSLTYMVSRQEAWEMLRAAMQQIAAETGDQFSREDYDLIQEMLAGITDFTPETCIRLAHKADRSTPLISAFDHLLREKVPKKNGLIA